MTTRLRERALRLLARSEYTRASLALKLAPLGSQEDIQHLLDELEACGLLSDLRFVESFIASREARYGPARLRQSLRAKGVDEELIALQVNTNREDEHTRARALWLRRFGAQPSEAREYARQLRFLISRGFSAPVAHAILKDPIDPPD
jgi:regulatory protein